MPPNPYDTLIEKPADANPYAALVEPSAYDLKSVPEAAAKSVAKTVMEDIPNAAVGAAQDPLGTAEAVGKGGVETAKQLVGMINMPAMIGHKVLKAIGATESADKFKEVARDWFLSDPDALFNMAADLKSKYGSWEDVKRATAERPLTVVADIASVLPGVGKAAGITKDIGTGLVRAGQLAKIPEAARFAKAGITAEELAHLEPSHLDRLRSAAEHGNWDKKSLRQEYNSILHDEADVTPSQSMITGEHLHQNLEDKMRNGSRGPLAVDAMNAADAERAEQFAASNDKLRYDLTGVQDRLDPAQIGEKIGERFNVAHKNAKKLVSDFYEQAFDPAELAAHKIPLSVPEKTVKGLVNALNDEFINGKRGPFIATASTAPNTMEAQAALKQFSKTGRLPEGVFPGEVMPPPGQSGVSWSSSELMRRYLNGLRTSAKTNPTDLAGMRRVMDAYDTQMGKSNPLLNKARAAHGERVDLFDPQRDRAAAGVRNVTQAAANTENTGYTLYNKLFGGAGMAKGEGLGVVNQLKTIFGTDHAGMQAIREGALHKLFLDPKTYEPLSPAMVSKNIKQAISGPQKETYSALFNDDQMRMLSRRQALADNVANRTRKLNPSATSYGNEAEARRRWAQGIGASAGAGLAGLGHMAGLPIPYGMAELGGGIAGGTMLPKIVDPYYAAQARRMTSPRRTPRSISPLFPPAAEELISSSDQQPRGYFRGGRR